MLFLTLFQIVAFLLYVAYVTKRFGILESVSDSWYFLERGNPIFTIFCLAIGIPMFLQSSGHSTFFFLSGIGFASVGVIALFEKAFKRCVHYSGAAAGIFGALMGLWCDRDIWWTFPALVVAASVVSVWKELEHKIWWTEMTSFLIISAGLLAS